MRVLHLWDSYAPRLFDRSLSICVEEGIEPRLVCMHLINNEQAPDPMIRYVRRIHDKGGDIEPLMRIRRKMRLLVDRISFRRLAGEIARDFKPDVIHVHYGTTAVILENEKGLLANPFVISFYGFDISQGLRTPAIRAAYTRLAQRQPLVHVLCDEAAERAAQLGIVRDRIVNANLPLPVERYRYLGIKDEGPFRWLMPARFVEKKGHVVALRAFKQHVEDQPESRLTCWGYGSSAWLLKEVEKLGLSSSVDVIDNSGEGPFDEAYSRQLHEHDAVLAPSVRSSRGDDEGGPALTAVLAQVAGKPVIVSDYPGHERSVTDGIEGLVVPQGDVQALTAAMGALSRNRDRARAMGKAGRDRASREFAEKTYREALVSWYRLLAKEAANKIRA